MSKSWRNLSIDLSLIINNFGFEMSFVPFRFAKPEFLTEKPMFTVANIRSYHLFFGPFHFWTRPDCGYWFQFEVHAGLDGEYHDKVKDTGYNPIIKKIKDLFKGNKL